MQNEDIKILIDIDDTLINLCASWCEWLNGIYNLSITPEDITDWDIVKFFLPLTKEQVFEPLHNEQFWEKVKPKPGVTEYVKKLVDEGFNIYLCTSTDYRNVKVKYEDVILKYFPYISWKQVIVASHKQMIKADFLIDDGVHNLENGDYTKILISAPHNRWYDAAKNDVRRAENWEEVYKIIHDSKDCVFSLHQKTMLKNHIYNNKFL